MNYCYIFGLIGLSLLGGSISTISINEKQHDYLRHAFSDKLDKIYENIIIERRNQYIIGLIIGIIISFIILRNVKLFNYYTRITLFFAITIGTAILYYTIMPKSDYMLNHLKTPEENKKWLEVYKYMRKRYFIGALLGALSSIAFGSILC